MKNFKRHYGKILYALTFLVCVPAGLLIWAKYTRDLIQIPAIESKPAGLIFMMVGGFLILWGMVSLKKFGKGLPMNAFPPALYVSKGPYRFLHHPIYVGFGMLMIGWFIFTGSASGLWLVSPLTILGIIALVKGYEEIDLNERFPDQKIKTIFDLPGNNAGLPGLNDCLASSFWICVVLISGNFIVHKIGGSAVPLVGEPLHNYLGYNLNPLSFLSFIFLITTPFYLKRNNMLREWVISSLVSMFYLLFVGLLYPQIGAQYLPDEGYTLFTVPISLLLLSLNAIIKQARWIGLFILTFITLVVIQLFNSRSALLHCLNAIVIFFLSVNYLNIWGFLRNLSEKIANSWKEWVFGKVRVINHGFYVGFGGFFGILLAGILAGKGYALALLVSTIILVICAALWAQFIEGSEKLKRPFGFYGGLVGILFGTFAVWVMGINCWIVIGVCSVVMPWVQAIGRLRCLVNGCCHGRRIDNPFVGIRINHPRSRVCNLSGLKGELIHATQLYSIIWLFWVGILLIALWNKNFTPPFIFGLYLILVNLGRFVEEAYRGEVQTPSIRGLHIYQWTAIISILSGILMTVIKIEPVVITPCFSWESFFAAAISGLFIFFAMGVDFPYSNARFSRLV